MATRSRSDARGKRFWERLVAWYGTRITEQYGKEPPEDWVGIVDDNDNETVRNVLSLIRQKHVSHPPTFPEVAALFAASIPKPMRQGRSSADRREELCEFIMRSRSLGKLQLALPWTWLVRFFDAPDMTGKMVVDHGAEFIGVVIPRRDGRSGYRVTFEDMDGDPEWAATWQQILAERQGRIEKRYSLNDVLPALELTP